MHKYTQSDNDTRLDGLWILKGTNTEREELVYDTVNLKNELGAEEYCLLGANGI
jgi:hypothetical protein